MSRQVFFPSNVKVYGSALKVVQIPRYTIQTLTLHKVQTILIFSVKMTSVTQSPINQVLYISRTHMKALDHPSHRCTTDSPNPNTSACIASYIMDKIGCHAKIEGNQHYNGTKPLCQTKAQLLALRDVTNNLQEANGNKIYNMTGCLSSCSKDHYRVVHIVMNLILLA